MKANIPLPRSCASLYLFYDSLVYASGLRVAGQDSDMVDIFSPSDVSWRHLDVALPFIPDKQMYGNKESIKSWIDAIERANTSVSKFDDPDDANVCKFATHPFKPHLPSSPFSDEFGSESDISFCSDTLAWAPEVFASSYHDDSEENRSESSLSDDAQHISIPRDSLWYRPPPFSPGPISAHELTTAAYASSCSSDVRQHIAQQELLLTVFYEELRRVVPHDDGAEYDTDWLEDMDIDIVLAPLETYADICWESTVCEMSPSPRVDRPMPDVPIGFDEVRCAY